VVVSAAMIDTVRLRRVAKRRGIGTFYQLARAFEARGYSCSDSQAQRFWDGSTDPKLSSVVRLCEVLGCAFQDIMKPLSQRRRKAARR
jgi:Cro/C1-type helix-turn-helix DNA-binding protein